MYPSISLRQWKQENHWNGEDVTLNVFVSYNVIHPFIFSFKEINDGTFQWKIVSIIIITEVNAEFLLHPHLVKRKVIFVTFIILLWKIESYIERFSYSNPI